MPWFFNNIGFICWHTSIPLIRERTLSVNFIYLGPVGRQQTFAMLVPQFSFTLFCITAILYYYVYMYIWIRIGNKIISYHIWYLRWFESQVLQLVPTCSHPGDSEQRWMLCQPPHQKRIRVRTLHSFALAECWHMGIIVQWKADWDVVAKGWWFMLSNMDVVNWPFQRLNLVHMQSTNVVDIFSTGLYDIDIFSGTPISHPRSQG